MEVLVKKVRNKIMLPAIIFIFSILILAFSLLTMQQNEQIVRNNNFVIDHMNTFIQSEIIEDANSYIGLINVIQDNPDILKSWNNKNKEELYLSSINLYNSFNKTHRITHFYFHELSGNNFLRVHQPDRFGDLINRHTLSQAQITQLTSYGIETGLFGQLVLRVVSPWLINNKLIGYIELGVEIEHILQKASKILDTQTITLINKENIHQEEWEFRAKKLNRYTSWLEFPEHITVESSRIKNISQYFPIVHHALTDNKRNNIIKINENSFFTGKIPLIDVSGEKIGFLVFFKNISQEVLTKNKSTQLLLMGGVILSIILLTLYYFYIGRIERFQEETFQQLKTEMKNRIETEKKLTVAKDMAEHANKTKSIFLSQMSHELRTPMNAIMGFAQILDIDELNDDQQENINQILLASHHLLDLINKILDLSTIESGNININIQAINLNEIIDECITLISPLTNKRYISINKQIKGNYQILADMSLFKQVLINILSNATKYNCDNGSITLSIDCSNPKTLKINVTDTGTGISENDLLIVFQPFERLNAKNSTIEGAGVGLSICKQLMESMHGSIGVTSSNGNGCCFWIEFPRVS